MRFAFKISHLEDAFKRPPSEFEEHQHEQVDCNQYSANCKLK